MNADPTSDQIFIPVIYMHTTYTENVELYFKAGRPAGHTNLKLGFELEPKFVDLDVHVGSEGGSIINAIIRGLGPQTKGTFDLQFLDGTSLCESAQIVHFEYLECTTNAMAIPSATELKFVWTSEDDIATDYLCANPDTTQCEYMTDSPPTFTVTSS